MFHLRIWAFLLLLCNASIAGVSADVLKLEIHGPIGVATMEYVVSGIDAAHQHPTELRPEIIVLQMDTPGGLDTAMREMIQRILASEIPIVGFVAPQGARAASAGTYLLYATHIAAMSPATTLGAATPVQIGMPRPPGGQQDKNGRQDNNDPPKPQTAMERKILNDAKAYIEGLADLRQRNREWAVQAVEAAEALSAQEALERNVINIVANDIEDLLRQLDGQIVSIADKKVKLNTANASVETLQATWRQKFLSIVGNPGVAYILMLIGVYGLIFEFSNPGGGVLGITGVACIILALYGFQLLPINYAGLALILFGVGLMALEAFIPGFGIFGVIGTLSLITGSVILIDSPEPALQIAWQLIAAVAICSAAFTFLIFIMLYRTRKLKVVSGVESIIGKTVAIEEVHNGTARARVQGELWQVEADCSLAPGDEVTIKSVHGLTLNVDKQPE